MKSAEKVVEEREKSRKPRNLWEEWSAVSGEECSYSESTARVEELQSLEVNTDAITG